MHPYLTKIASLFASKYWNSLSSPGTGGEVSNFYMNTSRGRELTD